MCGIAGIVERKGASPDRDLLAGMVGMLAHRGPDGNGIHIDGNVGLAHARLSIIDLAGGAQPMELDGGRLCITFNGEIFNYVELREELIAKGRNFATRSDTEVILHLYDMYGAECVQHLNGQWAFAIYDRQRKQVFLSRDRMGIRPLFYTFANGRLLFASEIKAIFADETVSREVDLRALDQIFTFWCTLPSRSFFEGVHQLPPGHSALLAGDDLKVFPYWKLDYFPEGDCSEEAAAKATKELLDLLLDATRIRLRSDVPVGAYLSGGLDSTLTTALVRQVARERLRTFSIAFEDEEFDESRYQQEATEFLNTQHSSVRCTYDDIAGAFPDMVWHSEQPVIRTAPAPLFQLSKLVRDSGFKVVVTGEGADEVLGGYDIYKEAKVRRFWGKFPNSRRRPVLLKRLYPYMENIQQQSPEYLKSFFHVSESDLSNPFFSHLPRWSLTSKLKLFFSPEVADSLRNYDALADLRSELPPEFTNWHPFNQSQYLETSILLPGYILSSQGDRMAMGHSVEGRYPFLDYRVVQFAAKLPPALKMKVLDEKYLLKRAAEGLIPPSIIRRHKQPYRAPDGKSFFNSSRNRETFKAMTSPQVTAPMGIFKPTAVSALAAKFESGRAIGTKDNMALTGILSTIIAVDRLVNNFRGTREQCSHLSKTYATL